ncbi:PREDICTED: uncharacterized protein LOC109116901 [Tarenaya hassleriana]|uniref:uncharacterized protein LOC109116901 n=1 Tax=Tarenaya hassleriana TaxID=28532 RepID=UPI0008FCEE69|nr:PREDICTED: uncharacterized protein LOC109116901 [Tarenaya hassleriana]
MGSMCCMSSCENGGGSDIVGWVIIVIVVLSIMSVFSSNERRVSVRVVRCR